MTMHSTARLGIDLGGSKIELIALDAAGASLWRRRVTAPRGDYEATLGVIEALVRDCETALGVHGSVGIGIPGALSASTGRVKNAYATPLLDRALVEDLTSRLERPVRIANDANCFALSEALDGAGAGAETVFGVILGTGVGGGLVVRGQILVGANAIAGEWGHNPLPWPQADELPGPRCACGRPGHIEAWLSGPGFAATYARRGGPHLEAPAIIERMRAGEPRARECFERYVDRLARALATMINSFDPHVIVFGGGLSNVAELYAEVPARWGAYIYTDAVVTRLRPNRHGDASGVRGAAWLGGQGGP